MIHQLNMCGKDKVQVAIDQRDTISHSVVGKIA